MLLTIRLSLAFTLQPSSLSCLSATCRPGYGVLLLRRGRRCMGGVVGCAWWMGTVAAQYPSLAAWKLAAQAVALVCQCCASCHATHDHDQPCHPMRLSSHYLLAPPPRSECIQFLQEAASEEHEPLAGAARLRPGEIGTLNWLLKAVVGRDGRVGRGCPRWSEGHAGPHPHCRRLCDRTFKMLRPSRPGTKYITDLRYT